MTDTRRLDDMRERLARMEAFRGLFVEVGGGYSSPCWMWTGARTRKGYGRFKWKNRSYEAHRFSYELWKGHPPESAPDLDHLCRNTWCVNYSHLEPVTKTENNRRKIEGK